MKIEFVNKGQEFELPKKIITVEDEINILEYIDQNGKEKTELVKRLMEISYTIYLVLKKIDKDVTLEMVKSNLSMEETGIFNLLFRTKGSLAYDCPHCGKNFLYMDLVKNENDDRGSDKNFQKKPTQDIIKTKKTT